MPTTPVPCLRRLLDHCLYAFTLPCSGIRLTTQLCHEKTRRPAAISGTLLLTMHYGVLRSPPNARVLERSGACP